MSNAFLGSVVLFGGNFAPRNWALCNGQILAISQNTALFSILGTTYGGNGQTTFALPDLRGRVAVSAGQGPGLSNYVLGQSSGTEHTTLTVSNLPPHGHPVNASNGPAGATRPGGGVMGNTGGTNVYASAPDGSTTMNAGMIGATGSSVPISIVQPYLAMNYIICLQGIFPSRN